MNKYIQTLTSNWDKLANIDPMSSILVDNKRENKCWDRQVFFSTGYSEIKDLMNSISRNDISFKRNAAMDFGCGIGRLTKALADEFVEVVGVDIAPKMIEMATKYCTKSNCYFKLNISEDLTMFETNSFDFIYSNIVFQHIKPQYTFLFLKEMLRVIKDDGLIVFQIPDSLINSLLEFFNNRISKLLLNKLYLFIRLRRNLPIEMYSIRKSKIESFLSEIGARIVHIEENRNAGPKWISYTYYVKKSH